MQYPIYAFLLSAVLCIVLGPLFIPLLKRLKFGQNEREDGPQSHLKKAGTPTMGGVIIIVGLIAGTLAFSLNATELALPALLTTAGFSLVGFLDDFLKVKFKNTKGLRAYQKIIAQFLIALVIALYAYNSPFIGSSVYFAFFDVEVNFGIWYVPFAVFVIVAVVNSVNLIDGVDGLSSGVTLIYAVTMTLIFCYMSSAVKQPVDMGQASQTQYAAELNSMAIFAAAVGGGCLGFLRFNSYPAKVFMGDTGSLALGGAVAVMALFSRSAFLFLIMGAVYVATAVSVVLQVGSYKIRKKRIFKMAPLHHHFELLGYGETKIVSMYMIITTCLCLVCLLAYV